MSRDFSIIGLYPIAEAYLRVVNEDAEGKNINRAERYVKTMHPEIVGRRLQNGVEMTPRVFTQEIRNLMPNVRGAHCKFLLGASRIYFEDMADNADEMQSKAASLNKILKLVASDAHVGEYDNDLNGMSLKELEDRFGGAVSAVLKDDMAAIAAKARVRNADYEIVRIPDFETARKYGDYTSWCVTHSKDMYDNYTAGGAGVFYFCLRKGYEDVPRTEGRGCPLDDYGLSMIAVSVSDDGSLNTCTCRWNHDNGGNDSIMTTKQISDLLGVDFYEEFRPRGAKDILAAYRQNSVYDEFAEKMGWIMVYAEAYVYYVAISEKDGYPPRIVKYRKVFKGKTDICKNALCIAYDHFYWYDYESAKPIPTPGCAYDDAIECIKFDNITSLDGCPKTVNSLYVPGCRNLRDIDELPEKAGYIYMRGSPVPGKYVEKLARSEPFLKSVFRRSAFSRNDGSAGLSENGDFTFMLDEDTILDYMNVTANTAGAVAYLLRACTSDDRNSLTRRWNLMVNNGKAFDETLSKSDVMLQWSDVAEMWDGGGVQYSIRATPRIYGFMRDVIFSEKYCNGYSLENLLCKVVMDSIVESMTEDDAKIIYCAAKGTPAKETIPHDELVGYLKRMAATEFEADPKRMWLDRHLKGFGENNPVLKSLVNWKIPEDTPQGRIWRKAQTDFAHRLIEFAEADKTLNSVK